MSSRRQWIKTQSSLITRLTKSITSLLTYADPTHLPRIPSARRCAPLRQTIRSRSAAFGRDCGRHLVLQLRSISKGHLGETTVIYARCSWQSSRLRRANLNSYTFWTHILIGTSFLTLALTHLGHCWKTLRFSRYSTAATATHTRSFASIPLPHVVFWTPALQMAYYLATIPINPGVWTQF